MHILKFLNLNQCKQLISVRVWQVPGSLGFGFDLFLLKRYTWFTETMHLLREESTLGFGNECPDKLPMLSSDSEKPGQMEQHAWAMRVHLILRAWL